MIPFIPKQQNIEEKRLLGYKVQWNEKDIKKKIDFNELDESEIEEIKEFELNVIKGKSHTSELLTDVKEVIKFYENIIKKESEEQVRIMSYYINNDGTIKPKRETNIYELKNMNK